MSKSYCNLLYHIVFSTKDRTPWLKSEIRSRVHLYLGGSIKQEEGIALLVGGAEEHIHILAKLRQDKAISDVLRDIKANSSGWVHETFEGLSAFSWQAGYGAFTVSQSQVERVRSYIAGKEEHHKKVSFKDEFVALLKAHRVEYDGRYLWEVPHGG